MTTRELATEAGYTPQYIRSLTKRAREDRKPSITLGEIEYLYSEIPGIGGRGRVYEYTIATPLPSRRVAVTREISWERLEELEGFDIHATKHTPEQKLILVRFISQYHYSTTTIIQALDPLASKQKIAALRRKWNRWVDSFHSGGKDALVDRRGSDSSFRKIDEEILRYCITGAGARGIRSNYYGIWDLYCYEYQKQHRDTFSPDNSSIISYTALSRAIKRLLKSDATLYDYWTKGKDGLLQSYTVGIKNITYTNQEWQADATPFDFMVRIPQDDGSFRVARQQLTAIIDVYSGNTIAMFTPQIDSRTQVRVLLKAIERMGMPEQMYLDNGRDYASDHYTEVLSHLGIVDIRAQVGQGRQKGKIERFFRFYSD